jgi:hypothetical protein
MLIVVMARRRLKKGGLVVRKQNVLSLDLTFVKENVVSSDLVIIE